MVPTVTQTFCYYTPVCWSQTTGCFRIDINFGGSSAWGTPCRYGNTGSNAAAKINLYNLLKTIGFNFSINQFRCWWKLYGRILTWRLPIIMEQQVKLL